MSKSDYIFFDFLIKTLTRKKDFSISNVCLDFLESLEEYDYSIPNELVKHLIAEDYKSAVEFLKKNKAFRKAIPSYENKKIKIRRLKKKAKL